MYRSIDCKFWTDPKIRSIEPNARYLFFYLITNPHSHYSGFYYLPRPLAIHETGLSDRVYDTLCHTLSDTSLAFFDTVSDTVFIPKMMKYQAAGEKNKRGAEEHSKQFRHSRLYPEFCKTYEFTPYPDDTLSYTLSHRVFAQEQEQEQEQEQNIVCSSKATNDSSKKYPDDFEAFWKAYPACRGTKAGKGQAGKTWRKMSKSDRQSALDALAYWKQTDKWANEGGKYIPMASTYLNRRDFDDLPDGWNPNLGCITRLSVPDAPPPKPQEQSPYFERLDNGRVKFRRSRFVPSDIEVGINDTMAVICPCTGVINGCGYCESTCRLTRHVKDVMAWVSGAITDDEMQELEP